MKKILISPFFGKLPPWFNEYKKNTENLKKYGWDFLVLTDLDEFIKLIKEKLGLEPHIVEGTCKASDFRPALGIILEDRLKNYDFWGHTDLDCIYGRLDKFITNQLLENCDIYSNDIGHMCGPMSLYKNTKKINNLFKEYLGWQSMLESANHYAFDEQGVSTILSQHPELKIIYKHWEGKSPDDISHLSYKHDSLFDGEDEIMYYHFNHLHPKKWPV